MRESETQSKAVLMQKIGVLLDQLPDDVVQQLAEKWRLFTVKSDNPSSTAKDQVTAEPCGQ